MITLIRKNQKVLMIIITVLVIIAFAWLYNNTDLDKLGANTVGRIYGRSLTQSEIDRRARTFNLAASLGLFDLISGLGGQANDRGQAIEAFVLNGIVLDHESKVLQIVPTDAQVAEVVKQLPVFQTNGKFDLQRYAQFVERTLAPNGFTENQLEDVVRSQLELSKIRDLVSTQVVANPIEVRDEWERRNRIYNVEFIRFNEEDFSKDIQVSEEEVKAYYEDNKSTLLTEEQRSVQVVKFLLGEAEAALEGPERIKVLQATADKAGEFAQAVLEPEASFEALVQAAGLKIEQIPLFTQNAPPEELADFTGAAEAAFTLSKEDPNSDPIQGKNGFLIMRLDEIVPSQEMTLDAAKKQIIASLTSRKVREAMSARAQEIKESIKAEAAAGSSFADAAQKAGLPVESMSSFSLSKPNFDSPDAPVVYQSVIEMKAGETSDFVETPTGGLLVHVVSTSLPEDQEFENQREQIAQALLSMKKQVAFFQWLTSRIEAAGVQGVN